LLAPKETLPSRKTVPIEFRVLDASTNMPASDLQPYLGVAGHLMLVHEDASTFVHSHPLEDGSLQFLASFPKGGVYRGWLQFQGGEMIQTADFLFTVETGR
jgi:hypothetical protein